jgi:hypothetical protein
MRTLRGCHRSLQAASLVGVGARIWRACALAAALGDERAARASSIGARWKRVGRGVTGVDLARALATARSELCGTARECETRRLSDIRLVLGERPLVDCPICTRADERARVSFGDRDAIYIRRATLVVVRRLNGPFAPVGTYDRYSSRPVSLDALGNPGDVSTQRRSRPRRQHLREQAHPCRRCRRPPEHWRPVDRCRRKSRRPIR